MGAEFRANSQIWDQQSTADVAILSDQGWVVTWQSYVQDSSDWGIYGQRYDALGNPVGDEFWISTRINSSQTEPQVTALNGGGFLVAWQSYAQDSSGWGLYGQRFDGRGEMVGSEFRINTFTTYDQANLALTSLADGRVLVLWDSYAYQQPGEPSWSTGIFGTTLSLTGAVVGLETLNASAGFLIHPFDIPGVAVLISAGKCIAAVWKPAALGACVGIAVRTAGHILTA